MEVHRSQAPAKESQGKKERERERERESASESESKAQGLHNSEALAHHPGNASESHCRYGVHRESRPGSLLRKHQRKSTSSEPQGESPGHW